LRLRGRAGYAINACVKKCASKRGAESGVSCIFSPSLNTQNVYYERGYLHPLG
jgi:hypothetical protein